MDYKMNIWLLAGYAGSGKTTAATILQTYLPKSKLTAFAKRVKDDVAKQYNIDRELLETQEGKSSFIQDKTVRDILIEYSAKHKEDTQNPSIWAEYVRDEILQSHNVEHWIIHDWRYSAEYQTLLTIANVTTIRILNPSVCPSNSPSEHELDNVITDYVVKNSGSMEEFDIRLQEIIYKS